MQRGYRGALQFPLVAAVVLAVCPHAASAAATAGIEIDWAAESYSLADYLADFGKKSYYGPEEAIARRAIFAAAREAALLHNADATKTWKKAINQFSDRTAEEFRGSHGWVSPRALQTAAGRAPRAFATLDIPWQRLSPVRPPKIGGLEGQGRGDQDQEPRHVRFMLGVLVDGEYRVPRGTGDEHHA